MPLSSGSSNSSRQSSGLFDAEVDGVTILRKAGDWFLSALDVTSKNMGLFGNTAVRISNVARSVSVMKANPLIVLREWSLFGLSYETQKGIYSGKCADL